MGGRVLWGLFGVLSIAGGILALMNPFGASFAATVIAGWVFILIGILEIIGTLTDKEASGKIWMVLLGVLAIWLGFSILQHPLAGMVSLTVVVAISFLAAGVFKVVLAFSMEDKRFFWLILLSGVVSVVLAVMIFSNFPQSAATVLGILLGIDLISNGATLLAVALSAKPSSETA
ncbi:MAG: DUF308 domain-containing protein [Pseudomonadota bacterium]